jgi:hypothetical protein
LPSKYVDGIVEDSPRAINFFNDDTLGRFDCEGRLFAVRLTVELTYAHDGGRESIGRSRTFARKSRKYAGKLVITVADNSSSLSAD